ncbi:hypothetical protein [Anaeromicropila populeti]|uniref:Tetratricopeptide repeat-containing protein n=1 Tax=Anaeromicropila populeti TaxID=37658 RepID=A0A1I6KL81_9FIRM|nr:hypothetical protein [Anaeromicropila populeti]SFR91967.1 hypothetical protein SAMN05661086_02507 [Anaeromicropila populeti]
MGKFILCSGAEAAVPFHVEMSDIYLYTIEELCYYMYENIYIIEEEFFNQMLYDWIKNQLEMDMLVKKLESAMEGKMDLKSIVVTILCSTDYYTEGEIKELILVMDQLAGLTSIERRKKKADQYLKNGNYAFAAKEYDIILNQKESSVFTQEQLGNLLHNYGITLLHIATFCEAAQKFEQAYCMNRKVETLKYFILALQLGGLKEKLDKVTETYRVDEGTISTYEQEMEKVRQDVTSQQVFEPYKKLEEFKRNGEAAKFFEEVDRLLLSWKNKYRKEVS